MAKKKRKTKKEISVAGLEMFLNRAAKKLRERRTKWEAIIYTYLKQLGYKFKFQYPVICRQKHGYILDFLLTDYNIGIEIDSILHHTSPVDKKKDGQRTRRLNKEGYHVIRFMNKQVATFSKETVDQIIKTKIQMLTNVK